MRTAVSLPFSAHTFLRCEPDTEEESTNDDRTTHFS
jgi:hypothetical protein